MTGYNSEYSDRSFIEKRDMNGGFKESPLKLNEGLGTCSMWNEDTINARAAKLAKKAIDIWKAPVLDDSILETYKEKKASVASEYTIDSYPHLTAKPMRKLFDAFRARVLALDECVHEEFLKLYIAYKAETNFVDVVPQAKRLRLTLNLDYEQVDDPLGKCRDVSNLGRWGNGNVEVGLERLEDLFYVIVLVRQALERQLGEEELET